MKRTLNALIMTSFLAFSLSLNAQQPAPPSSPPAQPAPSANPAPVPAPSPEPAATATPSPSPAAPSANPAPAANPPPANTAKEIPVISIGDQVKPINNPKEEKEKPSTNSEENVANKKVVRKTVQNPKMPRVDLNVPLVLESKQLVHSRLSQVGDEVVFVVGENYPAKGSPLLPKGTVVVGKISAMERMQKDQPGGIRVNLEAVLSPGGAAMPLSGTLEVLRQKGQDSLGGKEVFIPVGFKQNANLTKKVPARVAAKTARPKPPKGQLNSAAVVVADEVSVKLSDLKYPTRVDILVEAPQGMDVTDLKEDSIRIVRINDFTLPRTITPLDDKIKVADRNKNNVKDISYRFPGWDVIRYLPEGNSTIILNAQTKDGKPVEMIATIRNEYR